MLSWISDAFFWLVGLVPNWLYADDSPRYLIVRSVLGVLLIVAIVLAVTVWRNRRRDAAPGD